MNKGTIITTLAGVATISLLVVQQVKIRDLEVSINALDDNQRIILGQLNDQREAYRRLYENQQLHGEVLDQVLIEGTQL